MVEESRKSITKELDVCHDCAEYGGHFCDECLDEIVRIKENADGVHSSVRGEVQETSKKD